MMREPLLDDSFSYPTYQSDPEKTIQVGRRQFLQTAGLVGVALALSPKDVFAQDSEAGRWRDRVTGFVDTICNTGRARAINSQIYSANIYLAPRAADFHYYYSAPFIFVGTTVDPEEVICGNGFQVNRFPFYDVRCPCGGITDLNAFEIRRISNDKERERYGCVLAPYSTRTSLEYGDHADYRQTAQDYGLNPDQFQPEYKRVFKGKGRAYRGYQIAHKSQVGPNGKPVRDILLSSEDI
jgi:hypothetical protein